MAPSCTVAGAEVRDVVVAESPQETLAFEVGCAFVGAVRWGTIPIPGFAETGGTGRSIWGTSLSPTSSRWGAP